MRHLKLPAKVIVVPVAIVSMWIIPSGKPDSESIAAVEVAGIVEVAPLADASPTTVFEESVAPNAAPTTAVVAERAASISPPTTSLQPPGSTTSVLVQTSTTLVVSSSTTAAESTTTVAALSLGEQAMERVSYDWRSRFPDWQVEFHGARDGIRALTYPAEQRVEIFVRASDTAATLHRVFAHELGHVVDVELNSDRDRERWFDQRGIAQETPWWPSAEAPDFATGAGDFAEAFAVWETGVSTRSTIGSQPGASDLTLLRELSEG